MQPPTDLLPLPLQLCERPAGSGYVGSEFFNVRKGFGILGGDWEKGDCTGSRCAAPGPARYFADENFIVRHSAPGVLSMASAGVHKNGSVFVITLAPQPQMGACLRRGGAVVAGVGRACVAAAAQATSARAVYSPSPHPTRTPRSPATPPPQTGATWASGAC